jgi:alpha-L-arabinofuranosidase
MIRQIEDKNLFQKTKLFIQEIGFKTASAYALLVILLVAITVTFISVQKRQNLRQNAAGSTLTVDATKSIRPFTHLMLGQALVNWEHSWGKPFPNEVPGLSATMKTEGVGIIRYAGGLWANYVGFDRTLQRTPYTNWTKNGNTYSFTYGTDELDSLNKFADNIGADVMIQVDIAQNDPTMWADMVKYVNIEKGYNFKYWEFGNEFDVDTALNITPEIYAARTSAYIEAMKDVDPSIHIVSGVPGTAADAPRQGWNDSITDLSHYMTLTAPIVTPKGRKIDELSYHWYQACNSTSVTDLLQYQFSGLATTSWRNSYSRIWSQIAPSRVNTEIIGANPFKQGITELNFDACNYDNTTNGNHLNALWVSDILGRLSYNGLDFVTWYEGYGTQGYSQIYPDDGNAPKKLFIRPTYYAFYMYNKYFGDQMVDAHSYDDSSISIFASTDSKDPNKLKLRITNLTGADITVPINITGFTAGTGQVYVLQSTNPTDTSAASNVNTSPTTINGAKLDPNNLAASEALITPQTVNINNATFTYTFPKYSSIAMILSAGTIVSKTPTPTPISPTATPTPTPTPSPSPTSTITPTPTQFPTSTPTPTTPTPTPVLQKPGDANADNKVDIQDLSILLSHWNKNDAPTADFNQDGIINITDLSILLSNWGK